MIIAHKANESRFVLLARGKLPQRGKRAPRSERGRTAETGPERKSDDSPDKRAHEATLEGPKPAKGDDPRKRTISRRDVFQSCHLQRAGDRGKDRGGEKKKRKKVGWSEVCFTGDSATAHRRRRRVFFSRCGRARGRRHLLGYPRAGFQPRFIFQFKGRSGGRGRDGQGEPRLLPARAFPAALCAPTSADLLREMTVVGGSPPFARGCGWVWPRGATPPLLEGGGRQFRRPAVRTARKRFGSSSIVDSSNSQGVGLGWRELSSHSDRGVRARGRAGPGGLNAAYFTYDLPFSFAVRALGLFSPARVWRASAFESLGPPQAASQEPAFLAPGYDFDVLNLEFFFCVFWSGPKLNAPIAQK